MATVYLGIGSNIGNKQRNCEEAIRFLGESGDIKLMEQSRFYLTEPVGGPPQEDYLNGVLKVETSIPPEELLVATKDIEGRMGRKEAKEKDSPRIIDIDILLYDDLVMNTGALTIPHRDMHKRGFVLEGLVEIAPEAVHPILGKSAKELYSGL